MDYSTLAEYYEKLESTPSKLKKTEILAELLKKTSSNLLPKVVLLVQGIVFPKFSGYELGIAKQMMIKAISKATGFSLGAVEEKFKKTGDLGLAVEECIKSRKQATLLRKKLTVDSVFDNLKKLPFITGEGSQEKKLTLIAELIVSASPKEARYIVRTILADLRVGTAEGIIRDSIFQAFISKEKMTKEEKNEAVQFVENAYSIVPDFGKIAEIAKGKGINGLKTVKVQVGKPIQVMLGLAAESIDEVVKDFGKIIAEYKYDGARVQCHKRGKNIWIYTRRLEDVTKQFPDIVELCKKDLKARECIVEGEALGVDKKTGLPVPFQRLSQRIHRKYDIKEMIKEIPVQVNLFDVVYLNGKMLFEKKLTERRKILQNIVKPIPKKLQLAKMIFTDDVKQLERFYKEALDAKQEGIFLKVPNSKYIFGRHVEGWYKIKPEMESLDCVVVGATWGEGARANWLTSYVLAVRDPDTGKFLECGMLSTGLTEEEYENMTKTLKPIIIKEKGRTVWVKPRIVMEAGYQEIQRSPNYSSGFALRFPRFRRVRDDKSPEDADTIDRLVKLFESQGRAG